MQSYLIIVLYADGLLIESGLWFWQNYNVSVIWIFYGDICGFG